MSDTYAFKSGTTERSLSETLGSLDHEIGSHRNAAATLKKEAEALLERARDHERVAAELDEARKKLSSLDVKIRPKRVEAIAPRQRERRTSFAWQVRKHALELISDADRPLGRAELLDGLIQMGVVIGSIQPSRAIGRIMWKAEEFEYKNNGYWIAGRPLPEETKRAKRYKAPKGEQGFP